MCKDKKIIKSILFFIVLILSLMFFATNVYALGGNQSGETKEENEGPTGSANTEQEARETWDDALREAIREQNPNITDEELEQACQNYYIGLQYEGDSGTISSDVEHYVDLSTEGEIERITPPTPTTTPPLHEYIFVEVATEAECEERANEEVEIEKVQNIIKSILFL